MSYLHSVFESDTFIGIKRGKPTNFSVALWGHRPSEAISDPGA